MSSTESIIKTLLAQSIVVAQQAAESAREAATSAADVVTKAPINSPTFTGNPQAPTPALGDNSQSIATTAFLATLLGAPSGIATLGSDGKLTAAQLPPISVSAVFTVSSQAAMLALAAAVGNIAIRTDLSNAEFILTATPASTLANWTQIGTSPVLSVAGLTGAIVAGDLMTALAAAPLASPTFTGTPAVPTAAAGTNTTQAASTAFVATSFAPLASPMLTGTPLAPTAAIDTNTGQIATTAFVLGQGSQVSDGVPVIDGTASRGTSVRFARADHVHPTDTSRAPLASPTFTGNPQAPTPTAGDNTQSIATTAFVQNAVGGVTSPFTTGDVKPTIKTTADTGWVMLNDGTIGSASSGASTRQNVDTQALSALIYANMTDANAPLFTSTGAATTRAAQGSFATAWANNCRFSLPKALGRAMAAAGAGAGLTSRALGQTFGEEGHSLTITEQVNMPVSVSISGTASVSGTPPAQDGGGSGGTSGYSYRNDGSSTIGASISSSGSISGSGSGTATGGGSTSSAHNTMQPTTFINWMIKL